MYLIMPNWQYFTTGSQNKFKMDILNFYWGNLFENNLLIPNENDLNRKLLIKVNFEIEKNT